MIRVTGFEETSRMVRNTPEAMGNAINPVIQHAVTTISINAKSNHRFQSRSGKLLASIGVKLSDTISEVGIDPSLEYGKYVHDGQRSWAPDQFIYNAAKEQDKQLERALNEAIDKALEAL